MAVFLNHDRHLSNTQTRNNRPHILHAVKSNAYVVMQISEIWVSSVGLVDDSNR